MEAINAARYPYIFIAAPYCGKPVRDPGEYYVLGTFEVVKKMVDRLESIVTYLSTGFILQFLLLCGCTKKILLLLGPFRSTGRYFLLK